MPKGHKENCQCSICVRVRNKAVAIPAAVQPEPPKVPTTVSASSLGVGDRFILNGERFQAGIKDAGMLMVISLDKPRAGRQMLDLNQKVFLEK